MIPPRTQIQRSTLSTTFLPLILSWTTTTIHASPIGSDLQTQASGRNLPLPDIHTTALTNLTALSSNMTAIVTNINNVAPSTDVPSLCPFYVPQCGTTIASTQACEDRGTTCDSAGRPRAKDKWCADHCLCICPGMISLWGGGRP